MKKLLLSAVTIVMATLSVNAASFIWGSNGTASRFLIDESGGTAASNRVPTGSVIWLVYLGSGTTWSFDDTLGTYNTLNNFGITGGTVVQQSALTAAGAINETYAGSPYTSINGNYAFVFFNTSDATGSLVGVQYGTAGVFSVSLASETDNTVSARLSANTGLSGTISVPEPATAGLALAGLALLFKRRRK